MLVIDASVALKFVTEEPDTISARALLASPDPLIAPDWLLAECASGLAKKVLNNGLPEASAAASLKALPQFFARLHPTVALLEMSLDLSLRLGHAFYDCIYLALALREDAMLVAADARFVKAAARGGFGRQVRMLGNEGNTSD